MPQATVDDAERTAERGQLRRCQLGFRLAGAALALQLVALFLSGMNPPKEDEPPRYPVLADYAFNVGTLCLTLPPAAWFLFTAARSRRWARAAAGLAAVAILDAAAQLALAVLLEPGAPVREPEPLAVRLLAYASGGATWVELWLLAVLIGEFAISSRSRMLADRSEYLGYAILAGATVYALLVAWLLPMAAPRATGDDVATVLSIVHELAILATFLWSFQLASTSAAIAGFFARRAAAPPVEEP